MFSSFYPTIIGLIHDMSDLEAGYTKLADIRSAWKNMVAAADVEKAVVLEQLKSAAEREAKLKEEVFQLIDAFISSGAELKSAHGTISALDVQVKSKRHSLHRLRRERDGCIEELKAERRHHRANLERLALAEEELSSAQADTDLAKAEAESAKEALDRAVKDF
uniref:Uncharacterized protein LOC109506354 n=2 Tax=Elaeis guineensis var. tenera TaxID=51953 RepID=A0A6J0PNF3_ELAGV|nr:uncharacterized protein LOC109506354 [Elaeis guineensis]